MSNTKALFFDIDGTLLPPYPYHVPESAQRALKAAQAKGHKIFMKDYSKATGIQTVLDCLGLTQKDSFAFGDSSNDLPMLKYAGTSVAMGNSSSEILPYCTYQTTNIEDDGILNALKHFDLI